MQYADVIAALSYWCQQEQPDASFTAATPTMLARAELRAYRELQLAITSDQNFSLQTVAFRKSLDLTQTTGATIGGTGAVAQQWPVIVEAIAARVGNRWIPYQLCSLDWLNLSWPDETQFAPPSLGNAWYAMLDPLTALLAPVPDAVYPLRVAGQWRPAPISASNPNTWLWENIPDLAFAALMIEAMGYQRDFGAGSDDPRAAVSWEQRYQQAKASAMLEEQLRQGLGPGYTALPPTPLVTQTPPPMPGPPPQPIPPQVAGP